MKCILMKRFHDLNKKNIGMFRWGCVLMLYMEKIKKEKMDLLSVSIKITLKNTLIGLLLIYDGQFKYPFPQLIISYLFPELPVQIQGNL